MQIQYLFNLNKPFIYRNDCRKLEKTLKTINCDFFDEENRISNRIFVDKNIARCQIKHIWKHNVNDINLDKINVLHLSPENTSRILNVSLQDQANKLLDDLKEKFKEIKEFLLTFECSSFYSEYLERLLKYFNNFLMNPTHYNTRVVYKESRKIDTSKFTNPKISKLVIGVKILFERLRKIKDIKEDKILNKIRNCELIIGKNNIGNLSITFFHESKSALVLSKELNRNESTISAIKDHNKFSSVINVSSELFSSYLLKNIVDLSFNELDFDKQQIEYLTCFKLISDDVEKEFIIKNQFSTNLIDLYENVLCFSIANRTYIQNSLILSIFNHQCEIPVSKQNFSKKILNLSNLSENKFYINNANSCFSTREQFEEAFFEKDNKIFNYFSSNKSILSHNFRYRFISLFYYQITSSIYTSMCNTAYGLISAELQYISEINLKISRNNRIHRLNIMSSQMAKMYNHLLTLTNYDINYFMNIYSNEKELDKKYYEIKSCLEILWQESNMTNGKDIGGYSLALSFLSFIGSIITATFSFQIINFLKGESEQGTTLEISFDLIALISFCVLFGIVSIISLIYFFNRHKKH